METSKFSNKSAISFAIGTLAVITAFGGGLVIGSNATRASIAVSSNLPFDADYIQNIYSNVKNNYLGDIPDGKDLTYGVAKGIVESLGSEYSSFLNPTEAHEYLNSADSAFEGIGVTLGYDGTYTKIVSPLDGYPGQKAGLLPGDLVIEVNGENVTGKQPEIVTTKIRGKADTQVKLKIYRPSTSQNLDFEITRTRIKLDNITYKEVKPGIFKINIVRFTEGPNGGRSGPQVFNDSWDKVVQEVSAKSPKGIILDLRNNPGGYVESVRHVAEEFLKQNQTIMGEEEKNKASQTYTDTRGGKFENIPVTVLVNSGSASASEILSAAIQDNKIGKVVGETTVGKGVEQTVITLPDNSLLIIVFQKWLTPSGRQITKETPITPDYKVDLTPADAQAGKDPQLDKALEVLGK
jgi:carboxyl-terminal processing protease